jgi:hypothetical protein
MAVNYSYNSSTTPTSTGTTTVNTGFQPTALIGLISQVTSGSQTTNASCGIGFWTSGSQWAFGNTGQNGTTSPVQGRFQVSGDFLHLQSPTNATATALIGSNVSATSGTGYTLDFTTVQSSQYRYGVIALGGDIGNAAIAEFSCPASTGNQTVSLSGGLGTPTVILFVSAVFASSGTQTGSGTGGGGSALMLGWANSSSSQGVSQFGDAGSMQLTNKCISFYNQGTAAVLMQATLSSVSANQFVRNWTTVASGEQVFAICLYGNFNVATFSNTSPTSNGNQANSLSFSPTFCLLQTLGQSAGTGSLSADSQCFGLYDGTNSVAFGTSFNAPTKSNSVGESVYDSADCLFGYNSSNTLTVQASGVDVTSEIKLDFTTTTSTAQQYIGLALGSVAVTAPGTPTNLVASYASSTSTTLAWTQGSGTVTDNLIKYGTDGSTFGTTIDIGSAATTYTVTGLTANQLYFFEVAAENTGGTSAYTAPLPFVCGSNLTLQVSQSSDDAYQTGSTVTIADSTDAPAASSYIGWRFLNATLYATPITNAVLYFYLTANSSPAGHIALDCQMSTSPATFTTGSNNISNRTLTGAGFSFPTSDFVGTGWNNAGGAWLVNGLTTLLNQPGWASGDNVAVIASFDASFTGLTFEMYDGNPVQAAILAIYTGSNPVWSGFGVTGGIEESGRVGPGVIAVQTAVIGSACW